MMKYNLIALILAISFLFMSQIVSFANFNKSFISKNQLHELKIRDGLCNFFEKINMRDSIKVGYFGGSITEQNGWRIYSLEWFQKHYPGTIFSEINAAIGGTPSEFGVFRLQEHLLAFKPDLIFVEFAVNDANYPSEKIIRSMEGIVRQVWQDNPKTDICFIYTTRESFLETEFNGLMPLSISTMEIVAEKYGIPSINFGVEVCRRLKRNKLIFKGKSIEINGVQVFGPDGTHPYIETGHLIYDKVLRRSFEVMEQMNDKIKVNTHLLTAPIDPLNFSNARMVDITQFNLSRNWEILRTKECFEFERYLPNIGKADNTSEPIIVRFKGSAVGAYDLIGPGAGRVSVEIDGSVKDTITRFDKYCTYYRMNYFIFDHLENTDHEVIFRVVSEPFNKEAILKEKEAVMKNTDDYKDNNWYVGKILIDGNVIQ